MQELAAGALGIGPEEVIVASTGVIGQVLPIEPIADAVGALAEGLSEDGSEAAARDYDDGYDGQGGRRRGGHRRKKVRIGGIAKGSGMIHPNMATMLCFLTTDASISPEMLDKALRRAVEESFNMISIDGDTSTNDMVSIMASGLAGNEAILTPGEGYAIFVDALRLLCVRLARMIAKDGEGATKLLVCRVTGAKDKAAAIAVSKAVIASSLVKAAMFGADANWGRCCARSGMPVCRWRFPMGCFVPLGRGDDPGVPERRGDPFDEDTAKQILSEDEIDILVTLRTARPVRRRSGVI